VPVDQPADQALLLNLPAQMRERQQWLLWRFERYEGDKKPRKVPYYVSGRKRRGAQGSAEDRDELRLFDVALAELQRGRWDGLGFAFLPGDGLIGIDIDGAIDGDGVVSERCQAIIDACASYTEFSPSGRGVHIIVQSEPTKTFKDNRIGLEVFCGSQFFTCTGRMWPGSVQTLAPLAEHTLRRLQATVKVAKGDKPAPAAPSSSGTAAAAGSTRIWLEQALMVLDSGGCNYDDWIGIGMALKSALGEDGFGLWDYWSSKGGERYPGSDKLQTHWKSFAGADADGAMVIFKMARKGKRWSPPKAWHDVYGNPQGAAAASRAEGRSTPSRGSAGEVDAAAAAAPPAPPPAGDEPASEGPDDDDDDSDWRERLSRRNGGKADCRENVYLVLKHHPRLKGLVGYDEFAHRVMKLRKPPWDSQAGEWNTNDDYLLGFWLSQNERLLIKGEGTLVSGVAMAAYENRYHPVLKYLGSLAPWDGIERLPFWLSECLGADDTTYTRLVGTWFLLGMVRRVQEPGCQMDYMVVLEGLQGKRKSTALRTLVGNNDWFADTPIRIGDKDAMLSLAGKWLYEVGELDSFNKAEVTAVKQYVSSRIDRVREPFARRPTDRARSGVFAGSTNQSEYFKDPTGARRFWPVACNEDIDIDKLAVWRDQLFAEAMHRLASDDPELRRYYPTAAETAEYLVPEQEQREIVDPWFERLASWLNSKTNYGESGLEVREVENFTSFDLLTKCLMVPQDRIDGSRQMATRVGIAMHKLKWVKHRDATGARLHRYWRPGHGPNAPAVQPALAPVTVGDGGAAGGPAEELHEF
jgi:predicted P-loop ATPase